MEENERHTLDELEAEELEEIAAKQKKESGFNPFRKTYSDGEGVSKEEEQIYEHPNLKNFFKLLGRRLNQILSVNLMMVFGNFPLFFALFAFSGYASIHSTAPYFSVFAPLHGVMRFDSSPATAALMGIFGMQADITVLSTVDWVCLALSALAIFTFGPVNVGCTYILRNVFRGEGIFLWHDFFYAIKRNVRQGLIYGIMDAVIIFLLLYDIFFFNLNYGVNTPLNMMFFAALFMAILYLIMRPYIYLMLVTFDLSILKMFKNALMFTVLGVKRNAMSLIGILLLVVIEYSLLIIYFPLGVILPFVGLFSIGYMMQIYGAFPKIKQIMIDPYYENQA